MIRHYFKPDGTLMVQFEISFRELTENNDEELKEVFSIHGEMAYTILKPEIEKTKTYWRNRETQNKK